MKCTVAHTAMLADRLGALAHPARLEILRHLSEMENCCCKDVVSRLDLAQSTVSQHLKVLVEAGLVRLTPNGQRSLYTIDREALTGLSASFSQLLSTCCAAGAGK
jgi:ArsR family transcriptional regulator, arsenate/arsenite/antimonite-responsive transcriptional repressor